MTRSIVAGEDKALKIPKTTIMNKSNNPSIPPVIKTDMVGFTCSINASTSLPALRAFSLSKALLCTPWTNRFDLMIL